MFAVNAQPNIVHRFASCRVIKVAVRLLSNSKRKMLTCLDWVGMALLKDKVLFHRPFSYDQMACALRQSGSRELQLWPMSISGLFCVIPFSMIRLYENSYSRL